MLLKLFNKIQDTLIKPLLIFKKDENAIKQQISAYDEEEKNLRTQIKNLEKAENNKEIAKAQAKLIVLLAKKRIEMATLRGLTTSEAENRIETGEKLSAEIVKESEKKETSPEIQEKNTEFKESAPKYYEAMENLPTQEQREAHLNVAKQASMLDLQGGFYLESIRDNTNKNLDAYEMRAQIFLKKETASNGREIFKVQNLKTSYNIEYGIGAGHLLKPNIQTVTIIDKTGKTRTGKREIKNDIVGYFDEEGYIPIFDDYIIIPEAFDTESSEKTQEKIREEMSIYARIKEQAQDYQNIKYSNIDETDETGGENHPITTLSSLEKINPSTLQENKLDGKEIREALETQKDLKILTEILHFHHLSLHAKNEINGGRVLLNLRRSGKSGPEMLGWTNDLEKEQKELERTIIEKNKSEEISSQLEKLEEGQIIELNIKNIKIKKNRSAKNGFDYTDDSGNIIEDLEQWSIRQTIKKNSPTNTLTYLIKALEKDKTFTVQNNTYKIDHKTPYKLELDDLKKLHRLTEENPERLVKILEELKKQNDPIPAKAIIEKIFPSVSTESKTIPTPQINNQKEGFKYKNTKSRRNNNKNFAIMGNDRLNELISHYPEEKFHINPFRQPPSQLDRKINKAIKEAKTGKKPLSQAEKEVKNGIKQAIELHEKISWAELKELHQKLERISDPGEKVALTATSFINIMGLHCGTWALMVYEFAIGAEKIKSIFRWERGTHLEDARGYTSPQNVRVGDWIYTHTPGNRKFMHSAIVLGIKQIKNRQWEIQSISYPNLNNQTPLIVTKKFTDDPNLLYRRSGFQSVKRIKRPT